MKRRTPLYILRDGDKVIAIGEDREIAFKYITQFYKDFEAHNITLQKETNQLTINRYLDKFIDTAMLQYYTDDLVLTEYEYNFYNLHFRDIYSEFKTTITSLLTFKRYIALTKEENKQIDDLFKSMYDKCYSFDEFIKNIDLQFLFENIITSPLLSKDNISELQELMNKMNYDIMKDIDKK